jgi:hypothetical protein
MPGLEARIEETPLSGTFVAAAVRFTQTSGTPIEGATANDDGGAIAGIYSLVFEDVDPGVSATVKVSCDSVNNPNIDQTGKVVDLDSTTAYDNIIRGVDLVFSDDVGFLDTWTAQVRIGHSFGTVQAFGADAGIPSTSRKIRVYNTGDEAGQNCKAEVVNIAKLWAKVGKVFERVFPFAENATEKLTGETVSPYAITVENVTGSGAGKTMDLLVDGAPVDVINLTDASESTSEGINVVDRYRITSGDLEDVTFLLSQDAVDDDSANILIFDKRFMQIAPDTAGSPGTFGTADVDLTETGEATGVITAGGFADFHVRVLVNDGGNSSSNPHQLDIRISGEVSESANWTD